MLVFFRRYLFRLTEDSVAMALHCCLGGSPAGFHVSFENDRHYHFSVANKHVGFLIRNLKRITTVHFDVYFHLWRDGGADWMKERSRWEREEERSWTTTACRNKQRNSHKRVSFSRKLVQDSPVPKSRPIELSSIIKVGDIFCPLSKASDCVRKKAIIKSLDLHDTGWPAFLGPREVY